MKDIKNIEDLDLKTYNVINSLIKLFNKTLDKIEECIINKNYLIDINKNILESHLSIIKDLSKDIGEEYDFDIIIHQNCITKKEELYIFSNNYEKALNLIKKIKFYVDFQSKVIKGNA